MDELMWGRQHAVDAATLGERLGMAAAEVEAAYAEIDRHRVATEYLHAPAIVLPPAG